MNFEKRSKFQGDLQRKRPIFTLLSVNHDGQNGFFPPCEASCGQAWLKEVQAKRKNVARSAEMHREKQAIEFDVLCQTTDSWVWTC